MLIFQAFFQNILIKPIKVSKSIPYYLNTLTYKQYNLQIYKIV
jgi:hypothetical protein